MDQRSPITRARRGWRRCFSPLMILFVGFWSVMPAAAQEGMEPDEDFNKGGRTAFQFLKIGLGARQSAMGEAGIAVVRDVNSVFWNPANITAIETAEASFSYVSWLADMNYVSGAAGFTVGRVGTFALSAAALNYGDMPEALTNAVGGDARTGNMVTGSDATFGLAYARQFTDRLSIGIGAKYVHESLADFNAGTVAFDIGTFYDIGFRGLKLAMSAQNFGGSVQYLEGDQIATEEGFDLPLVFRLGISTNLIGAGGNAIMDGGGAHSAVVSAEVINTNDYSGRLHLGAEYTLGDLIALRAGYRFNYTEGNLALGAGLKPQLGGVDLRVDYAFVQYKYLDAPHRLTVSLGF